MPEQIAWIILLIVWIAITYLIGNDAEHIMDDDNSFWYRIYRGLLLQLVIIVIAGFAILVVVSFITVLGVL